MIDLHLHTTASDGRSTPEGLVDEALRAGLRTIAVTDHDTVGASPAVALAAAAAGLECVTGIEITAVLGVKDVHVLGYFIDPVNPELDAFLQGQRDDRRRRVLDMADELSRLGVPIDTAPLVAVRQAGARSLGRPHVAAALVSAGHARDIADAFDRYIGEGRPAYVKRRGESPAGVVARIQRAGGLASLAHPGRLGLDEIIVGLVDDGLAAIEVFHPDHDVADTERYLSIARSYGLLVTGGSDYHGAGTGRAAALGRVVLPPDAYAALVERASA